MGNNLSRVCLSVCSGCNFWTTVTRNALACLSLHLKWIKIPHACLKGQGNLKVHTISRWNDRKSLRLNFLETMAASATIRSERSTQIICHSCFQCDSVLEQALRLRLHKPSTSPVFFVSFKNGFTAVLWCCLHVTLKKIKGAAHKNGGIFSTWKRVLKCCICVLKTLNHMFLDQYSSAPGATFWNKSYCHMSGQVSPDHTV